LGKRSNTKNKQVLWERSKEHRRKIWRVEQEAGCYHMQFGQPVAQIAGHVTQDVLPDHLLLDRSPNIGRLIFRWELDKFKNCWNKSFRTSKTLTLLYQQFSNLLISQRDMSDPRLGALSHNRWSGDTYCTRPNKLLTSHALTKRTHDCWARTDDREEQKLSRLPGSWRFFLLILTSCSSSSKIGTWKDGRGETCWSKDLETTSKEVV
jgi:hypothetical protein